MASDRNVEDRSLAVPDAADERFVGRRVELREISARAVAAASARQQIVVVEGRPGIGKTAFVRRALALLSDFHGLYADCAREPVAEQLSAQAEQVLGHGSGPIRGGLATALDAVLARGRPAVVALDNAERIDAAGSADLSEALLATRAAALLIIVTTSEPWLSAPGEPRQASPLREQLLGDSVSRISLAELTESETGQLLDLAGAAGSDRAAARLHSYTGGHPALLSLLLDHGLTAAVPRPGDLLGLFDPLVLSILHTVSALPAPSRDLLAAMAVAEEPWPLAIVGSLAGVDDPFEALEPVLESGLADWYPDDAVAPVEIRYPLYRDVIYRSLPLARREVLHTRAANFALGTRAWAHRVAATTAEEPGLAAMLEQEARRYFQAGDSERAGTLLMWSAAISAPEELQHHLHQAAHWWPTLRAIDWGPRLPDRLSELPPSAPRSLILGMLAEAAGHYRQAQALLTEAEQLAGAGAATPALRFDIQLGLALIHADLGNADEEYRLSTGLLEAGELPALHRSWAEYHAAGAWARMDGAKAALGKLAAFVSDSAIDDLRASARPVTGEAESAGVQSVRLWTRGTWRILAGRFRDGVDDLAAMLRGGDRSAIEPVAPAALAFRGYTHFLLGDGRTAEHAVSQAIAALDGHAIIRSRVPVYAIAACVDATSGRPETAGRHVQAAQRWYAEAGTADYVAFPAIAAATVAQGRGDHGRMLAAVQPLLADQASAVMYQIWWLPLAVEALIGTRQLVAAARALRQLAEIADAGQSTATLAWLDAWLAASGNDENAARTRLEDGLARPPARDDIPLHRARLEHEFGRYLVSRRNRRAAIERLRSAYELYRALGARPFADRCADDLAACGAQLPELAPGRQGTEPYPALTPQERRIAHLAVQGLTNQEIASEVFVSAKTVEYHLGNVFAKLGISSRRQLSTRLR
jgi:DNA-binding CsgD family transcriptional regulator